MTTTRALLLAGITLAGCGAKSESQQAPTPLPANAQGKSCTVQKSDCPQQALDDYAGCVVSVCDAKYKMCFGDGYAAGNFGGPCKALIECGRGCANCDQACLQKCFDANYSGECKTCIEGPLTSCVIDSITSGACKLPCVKIGAGCDGLQACCNTLPEADKKKCEEALKSSFGQGTACDTLLKGYQMSGKCTGVNPQSLPGAKPTVCSKQGGPAATIKFENKSMKSITTWWVDFGCVEKKYTDIAPGASHSQMTFVDHPWRLRDTATRELLKEVPPVTMGGATVTVTWQ